MFELGQLAEIIKAQLIGDPKAQIHRARPFESASSGDITFVTEIRYQSRIAESNASAIIVSDPPVTAKSNLLIAKNPKLAFARAVHALHSTQYQSTGISEDLVRGDGTVMGTEVSIYPRVTLGRDCRIGDRVVLYPGVVIGDGCNIGDGTVIHANVSVYEGCSIGKNVIIHASTVIGADGFSFVPDEEGRQVKLLQLGRVVIEDDCEIGANCAIDRGGFGDTILKRGVKLDNLVQVGHNTEIGDDTVIAALTGFSGQTHIGRRCLIAGQVGTKQHVTVGDGAILTARAAITSDVDPGALVGNIFPARDHRAWRRALAVYWRLPEMLSRLRRVEQILKNPESVK